MADTESKNEIKNDANELPKWRQLIKKYKTYIIAAFTALVGYLAGDTSLQDAIISLFK